MRPPKLRTYKTKEGLTVAHDQESRSAPAATGLA